MRVDQSKKKKTSSQNKSKKNQPNRQTKPQSKINIEYCFEYFQIH